MKEGIHPEYHAVKTSCSCGNRWEIMSTMRSNELTLDVCSQCHPFYTGKQKIMDTAGRVEKFRQKYGKV